MKQLRYQRRKTQPVVVGNVTIGGDAPVVVQSMANVSTNDIAAATKQAHALVAAGCKLIRYTTQGLREVRSVAQIKEELRAQGCNVPLVADVHFSPQVAYEAAKVVEKVRINPGNFYDPARKFHLLSYSDAQYQQEVHELQQQFAHFLEHCKANGAAIRIGVNHGSLSDRIMSRYGDTPAGMVESCMEFLRVCQQQAFHRVVISIKASNPLIMITTCRLLCQQMEAEKMQYPLHLGVTEAGDGEDGRVKSAVGIGTLLAEGIGDTIRVSLSEDPTAEIPVAQTILQTIEQIKNAPQVQAPTTPPCASQPLLPGYSIPIVVAELPHGETANFGPDTTPDWLNPNPNTLYEVTDESILNGIEITPEIVGNRTLVVDLTHPNVPLVAQQIAHRIPVPFLLRLQCNKQGDQLAVAVSTLLGGALLEGYGAGLWLRSNLASPQELVQLSFRLLQATRRRITRPDYISCPGCGRTLFNLQETVATVKQATAHLKGLKIGIMGCIVNGPGEMADADYGYVGAAPGKIDLYKGKVKVKKGIPQNKAVQELVNLIKENGDWTEPQLEE